MKMQARDKGKSDGKEGEKEGFIHEAEEQHKNTESTRTQKHNEAEDRKKEPEKEENAVEEKTTEKKTQKEEQSLERTGFERALHQHQRATESKMNPAVL